MKILMISNMYPSCSDPYFGSFIRNIKEGLESNNASVDIIKISGQGCNILDKIKKYISFYKEILFCDLSKYDAIQVSYPSHTIFPLLLRPRFWNKVIVRFHGLEIVSDKDNDLLLRFRRLVSKISCKISRLVVVPSKYFEDEVRKLDSNVEIYRYPSGGIDTSRFYIKNTCLNENKGIKIGYVGRVDIKKGVDILIKSLANVEFSYELEIIGKGPLLEDMKILSEIEKVNARFLGAIDNDKLVDYYNTFDVFIFPTERKGESFGNVAIEAMACGIPVIGSRFAGLTEYIEDNYNGMFFEVSNINDLTNKVSEFNALSQEEKQKMSINAKNVSQRYEKIRVSREFKEYIENIFC